VFENRISFVPLFDLEKEFGQTTATFDGGVQCLEDDYFRSSAHNILICGAEFYGLVILGSQIRFSASFVTRLSKAEAYSSLQVNRPLSMKKEGIQTRKRKPKNPGQGNQGSPAGSLPSVIKSDMKASIQNGKLKSYMFICGLQIRTCEMSAK